VQKVQKEEKSQQKEEISQLLQKELHLLLRNSL
jgi:hypothetical protein